MSAVKLKAVFGFIFLTESSILNIIFLEVQRVPNMIHPL